VSREFTIDYDRLERARASVLSYWVTLTMAWINLAIAGILEIFWAISLKYTEGFSKLWPNLFTLFGMVASFYFLAQALKVIPVGTGYAIWTGIGAAGTAILGIILFGESAAPARLACITVIVAGIIGLKLTSP
jgi:quaternary ammonium compound-resistance protein SugE